MSDARMKALEAVAEAAEALRPSVRGVRLSAALRALVALDALPTQPQPAGEVVMLGRVRRHGRIPGAMVLEGYYWPPGDAEHGKPMAYNEATVALVSVRVTIPTILTIPATVEPGA